MAEDTRLDLQERMRESNNNPCEEAEETVRRAMMVHRDHLKSENPAGWHDTFMADFFAVLNIE